MASIVKPPHKEATNPAGLRSCSPDAPSLFYSFPCRPSLRQWLHDGDFDDLANHRILRPSRHALRCSTTPGLLRRPRVLSAGDTLTLGALVLAGCCGCWWLCLWWFWCVFALVCTCSVSPLVLRPTRTAYCAADVVKRRRFKKKNSSRCSVGTSPESTPCLSTFFFVFFVCFFVL